MLTKKLTSWSISRYHDYQQCPLKFKLKHLDGLKEPKSTAMERGISIHELAEKYVKGELPTLPAELSKFAADFEMLKKRFKKRSVLTIVEDSWAYTKVWASTTWNDWTGCYLRVKVDVGWEVKDGVLKIRDWKTGKYRDEERVAYEEQLELYALAAFMHPSLKHIHTVEAELAYLDFGFVYPNAALDKGRLTFKREQMGDLKKAWERRIKSMFADKKFSPKPNRFCAWCHFRKGNEAAGGGQCRI